MKLWLPLLALLLAQTASAASIQVRITGLRSSNGYILMDLHNQPRAFPDNSDRAFRNIKVKAAPTVTFTIRDVPPGTYAFSFIHDENNNGHMDNSNLNLPLEGFGFSRDPAIGFSAPKFGAAAFEVNASGAVVGSHVRYL